LTASVMLEFLGWSSEAKVLHDAVKDAVFKNYVTQDLGGDKRTVEVGDWLAEFVGKNSVGAST
jgi:isocitrate/isopropylmalate dehydrogenase